MARVIPRVDISEELEDWSSAVYGEEVRSANFSALTKLQQQTNDACNMFEEIAEDFDERDEQWAQDLQSVAESVTAAAGSASAAEASEAAAAGSASAASASESAAAASQAAADDSEAAAEEAADRAETAAAGVEYPVSYGLPQTLTPAQQQQAAENIGLGDVKASLSDVLPAEYSTTATYNKGATCMHEGKMYKCNSNNVTGTWNPSYWSETRIGNVATLSYIVVSEW